MSHDERARLLEAVEREAADHPERWLAPLREARKRHGLTSVPTFAWPVLLSRNDEALLGGAAERLARAVGTLLDEVIAGAYPGLVPLDRRTAAWLKAIGPPSTDRLAAVRFDVLFDPSTKALHLLEVQAGDPSGAGWSDVFAEAFLVEGPLADAFAAGVLRGGALLAGHADAALALYGRWRDAHHPERPRVAFACPDESFVRSDHEAMAYRYRALGLDAEAIDPRRFTVEGEALLAGGAPVHLVVRDTHAELVEDPLYEASAAFRTSLGKRAAVMNPLHDLLADDKALLAVLADPGFQARLPPDVAQTVAGVLPMTHVVTEAATTVEGEPLVETLVRDREAWVLKPADGFGGHDVILGDETEPSVWADAIVRATSERFVAQRRVAIPRMRLAFFDDEGRQPGLSPEALPFTLGLWCHGGRFSGAYARAGRRSVINVHQGGGLTPVFFVG